MISKAPTIEGTQTDSDAISDPVRSSDLLAITVG